MIVDIKSAPKWYLVLSIVLSIVFGVLVSFKFTYFNGIFDYPIILVMASILAIAFASIIFIPILMLIDIVRYSLIKLFRKNKYE